MKAAIVALDGPDLSSDEAEVLEAYPPAGVILFGRNIAGPLPLARLIGDLREVLPREAVILVDQEGGRVARLRPPDWPAYPAAGLVGACYARAPHLTARLAWLNGALIGLDCAEMGFDVVCAPVLDVLAEGATAAIGDRSFGADPHQVMTLAQAMADGLLSAGMQPVGKHAPGHGSARVDSHRGLPRIDATTDIGREIDVFAACRGLPWMMTAHIVYEAFDADLPATLSAKVLREVIRGRIGFGGVLVSDDLGMGALAGAPADLACAAIEAGCDVALHCSGRLAETEAVLAAVPEITEAGCRRMDRARVQAAHERLQLDRAVLARDQAALLAKLTPDDPPADLAAPDLAAPDLTAPDLTAPDLTALDPTAPETTDQVALP